jgi:polar amino acid transport system substrate-binding protein
MRLVTSHLPSLVHESGSPGGLQALVAELCKRAGLKPATQFVPWPRAQFLATKMPATAIYPLTRLPEREGQYRWLVPLYEENYVLLAVRGKLLPLEQMKDKRIALLRGAAQAAILKELGFHRFVEASSIDEVHRYLLGGMADAAFGERRIIAASLKGHAANAGEFDTSAPVRTTTAWLAGSLDFDDADIALFQRALLSMQSDGTQRRILAQYQLL